MSEQWELGLHPAQAEVHEPVEPEDRDEPTWARWKVARAEVANGVLQATGWEGRRECGCGYFQGVRLDNGEMTFGAAPCPQHGAENRRALDTVKRMPPSDEQMHELWQQQLDAEIEGA